MQIDFSVNGQTLTKTSASSIYADSLNFLKLHITSFSSDWANLKKFALFNRDNNTYEMELDDSDTCLIPYECTSSEGEFNVSVVGYNNSGTEVIATAQTKVLIVKANNINDIISQKEGRITTTYLATVLQTVSADKTTVAADKETVIADMDAAKVSEDNAKTSESNAKTSETASATYANNASISATNAATSETNAKSSETNAKTSETNSANNATTATEQATKAVNSALSANTSATSAANSANSASTSAQNAETSAVNSNNSASAASNSATNAANSATGAATSASNSANSASSAATSATNAKTSEDNAKTSETIAKSSESNASTSANNAATSEANAKTSETNSANNATTAQNAVDNIDNVVNSISWQGNTATALGKTIVDPTIAYGCVACCTTAGTTGSSKPTFSGVTMGGTVTDGTTVWTIMSSEYVYDEGSGYIWRKHFNPNSGLWVNDINEWGYENITANTWQELSLPITPTLRKTLLANSYALSTVAVRLDSSGSYLFTSITHYVRWRLWGT